VCVPSIVPVTPVYFVGDSNTLMFRHLLVDDPHHFPRPLVTTGCFVPRLSAHSIVHDGVLHERVTNFIRGEVLARPIDVGFPEGKAAHALLERTLVAALNPPLEDDWNIVPAPPVVLLVGTVDLARLASAIGPSTDFVLNDHRFNATVFEYPKLPLFAIAEIEELVRSQLAPLAQGIAAIRALGVTNVYVHSVMPPSLDDAEYFRVRGVMCSAKLRYKLALLMNDQLGRLAKAAGASFIDLWSQTTIDGVRDPRFALDVDHGNRAAAALTLRWLMEDLLVRRCAPIAADGEDLPF
jgi:hypothetical protein